MSRTTKKLSKNIKKVNEKKKEEFPIKNQIISVTKIIAVCLMVIICVIMIGNVKAGKYELAEKEAEISTNEIIASQTFSKGEGTYYVLFYFFGGDEELDTTLSEINTKAKIYKVNLADALNKNVISLLSDSNVQKAADLKIKGTTLIKVENNKNVHYLEGYDKIVNYLKGI